jgi:putative hydrolase of the HAD superfamily
LLYDVDTNTQWLPLQVKPLSGMKRAFIFDLDNTIFSVPSIGHALFRPLFDMLSAAGVSREKLDAIKQDVMRKPFQWVAKHYSLEPKLAEDSIEILKKLKHRGEITPFRDFSLIRNHPADKFIVTTGFRNMQESKVTALGLEKDFKEIFIIDPTTSSDSKKDIFRKILAKYGYTPEEVLIIGDDPDSEIKAANELRIDSVLYDKANAFPNANATYRISDYQQLMAVLK